MDEWTIRKQIAPGQVWRAPQRRDVSGNSDVIRIDDYDTSGGRTNWFLYTAMNYDGDVNFESSAPITSFSSLFARENWTMDTLVKQTCTKRRMDRGIQSG
jgi:hypothetical protein